MLQGGIKIVNCFEKRVKTKVAIYIGNASIGKEATITIHKVDEVKAHKVARVMSILQQN
jgi:hypothetical protein